MSPLENKLDTQTRPEKLLKSLDDENLIYTACGNLCKLRPVQRGICKDHFNSDGTLLFPWQYVARFQNDPIEKKPFFLPFREAVL